jgi:transposase
MAAIARKTKRYPTDLTDEEWERIAPLLTKPPKPVYAIERGVIVGGTVCLLDAVAQGCRVGGGYASAEGRG